MEKEITYRTLFDRFAKLGETFDEESIERFEDMIIEEASWSERILATAVSPEPMLG